MARTHDFRNAAIKRSDARLPVRQFQHDTDNPFRGEGLGSECVACWGLCGIWCAIAGAKLSLYVSYCVMDMVRERLHRFRRRSLLLGAVFISPLLLAKPGKFQWTKITHRSNTVACLLKSKVEGKRNSKHASELSWCRYCLVGFLGFS